MPLMLLLGLHITFTVLYVGDFRSSNGKETETLHSTPYLAGKLEPILFT